MSSEVLYVNEQGRFQIPTAELEGFLGFLHDNGVLAEAETADAFHSGTKAYGYGRLLHLYDIDSVNHLYQTWKQGQASRAEEETA